MSVLTIYRGTWRFILFGYMDQEENTELERVRCMHRSPPNNWFGYVILSLAWPHHRSFVVLVSQELKGFSLRSTLPKAT